MRAGNIDILKAICAFLIVCIHASFPGEAGAYFTTITRIVVLIFFMITGYFYSDTVAQHRERQQIKKMLYLVVEANVLSLSEILRSINYIQSFFLKKLCYLMNRHLNVIFGIWEQSCMLYLDSDMHWTAHMS